MEKRKLLIPVVAFLLVALIIVVSNVMKPKDNKSYTGTWSYNGNVNVSAYDVCDFSSISISEDGTCSAQRRSNGKVLRGTWSQSGSDVTITIIGDSAHVLHITSSDKFEMDSTFIYKRS